MEIDTQMLKASLKYHKRTFAEMAAVLGINRDTFARRLATQHFTIRDVHLLMDAVPLTMDEMERIFFATGTIGPITIENLTIEERIERYLEEKKRQEGREDHGEYQCTGAGCPAGKGTETQGNPAGNA